MERILLTGATGTTGGNLLRSAEFRGKDLLCTYRPREGRPSPPVMDGVEWVACDLSLDRLEKALPASGISTVIHAAAITPKMGLPPDQFEMNRIMAGNLCTFIAQRQIQNLVFLSTASVYGHARPTPYQEQDACSPADPYGWSQLAAEREFKSRLDDEKIAVSLIRLSYPFGFDPLTRQGNFLNNIFQRIHNGQEVRIGSVSDRIPFNPVFMQDVCPMIARIARMNWSGILNIGGLMSITLREMIRKMGVYLGKSSNILVEADMPAPLSVDIQKLLDLGLGNHFSPFETGLKDAFQNLEKSMTIDNQ